MERVYKKYYTNSDLKHNSNACESISELEICNNDDNSNILKCYHNI